MDSVKVVTAHKVSMLVKSEKALIIDSRTFCEFNTSHILSAVNVWSSKIRKKRLQQDSISVHDYLAQACQLSEVSQGVDIIVYDHNAPTLSAVPQDSFLHVLLTKLGRAFTSVFLLAGGFLEFQARYPELCEDSSKKATPLTTQSQPCMPVANLGPTRILPFLYLGSQLDANNKQLLQGYNILYELNVSVSCPKPEFVQDSHFMRIPVNDNFSEKLLPYFNDAFNFIDKVREGGGCVLVHCLAGISRSATVAIAYVMKHLSLPFEEAYMYVKSRRPTISPNINFVGQLAELDRQLRCDSGAPRDPVSAPVLLRPPVTAPISPQPTPAHTEPSGGHFPKSLSLNLRHSLDTSTGSQLSPSDLSPSTALARLSFPPSTPPRSPRSPAFSVRRTSGSPNTPSTPCPFFRDQRGQGANLKTGVDSMQIRDDGNSGPGLTKGDVSSPTSSTASLPSGPRKRQVSVCVIEVQGDKPVRYVRGEPLIIRETAVEAIPADRPPSRCLLHVNISSTPPQPPTTTPPVTPVTPVSPLTPPTPPTALPQPREVVVPISREVPLPSPHSIQRQVSRGGVWTPENPAEAVIAGPSQPRPGSPVPNEVQQSDSGILVPGGSALTPKTSRHTPHLPRCYSSSETHLSTRRVLEHRPPDFSTRKCSSYDEVGRAWPLCSATTPTHTHPPALPRAWELARSDSVSTSGFGSEISDSDFLAEDVSVPPDDPLGPFQAVFADVFPGDAVPPKPVQAQTSVPAPRRPASLPGVTGTYFSHLQNEPSLDMGVELDREEEEEEEDDEEEEEEEDEGREEEEDEETEGVELRRGSRRGRRGVEKKDSGYYSFLTEHPPVNTKTMGEGVRHTSDSPLRRERPKILQLYKNTTTTTTSTSFTSTTTTTTTTTSTTTTTHTPLTPPPSSSSSSSSTSSPSSSTSTSSSSSSEKRMTPEKRKKRGMSGEEKEEKRRSWEMEGEGGGVGGGGGGGGRVGGGGGGGRVWTPSSQATTITFVSGAVRVAQQLVQGVEQLVDLEMADLRRHTAAVSSRIKLLGRTEDKHHLKHTYKMDSPSSTYKMEPPNPSYKMDPPNTTYKMDSPNLSYKMDWPNPNYKMDPTATLAHQTSGESNRARSEPPIPAEEGLYRARSCPGLPRHSGIREGEIGHALVKLRGPRETSRPPRLNRYSCGALDLPAPHANTATFESCPDFGSLRHCVRRGDSRNSSSSSLSSTHSFTRLLQVS